MGNIDKPVRIVKVDPDKTIWTEVRLTDEKYNDYSIARVLITFGKNIAEGNPCIDMTWFYETAVENDHGDLKNTAFDIKEATDWLTPEIYNDFVIFSVVLEPIRESEEPLETIQLTDYWYRPCVVYNKIKADLSKLNLECNCLSTDFLHSYLEYEFFKESLDKAIEFNDINKFKECAKLFYTMNNLKSPSIKKSECNGCI